MKYNIHVMDKDPSKEKRRKKTTQDHAAEILGKATAKVALYGDPDAREVLEREREVQASLDAHADMQRRRALFAEMRNQANARRLAEQLRPWGIDYLSGPHGLKQTRDRMEKRQAGKVEAADILKENQEGIRAEMLEVRGVTLSLAEQLARKIQEKQFGISGHDEGARIEREKLDPNVKMTVHTPNWVKRVSKKAMTHNGKLRGMKNEPAHADIPGTEGWLLDTKPGIGGDRMILTKDGRLMVGFGFLETKRDGEDLTQRRLIVWDNESVKRGDREDRTYYSYLNREDIESDAGLPLRPSNSIVPSAIAVFEREENIRESLFGLATSIGVRLELPEDRPPTPMPPAVPPSA